MSTKLPTSEATALGLYSAIDADSMKYQWREIGGSDCNDKSFSAWFDGTWHCSKTNNVVEVTYWDGPELEELE